MSASAIKTISIAPQLASLANGIRILHHYEPSPVVYCGFAINAGTRDEPDNHWGIAHLIEHLLFKGTARRTNLQIIRRLEDIGGELNAYTTKEETFVYAVVPCKYTERAIELLADIVFESTFPDVELRKEREVIAEEIQMYNDSPSELIFDELEDIIFKDSALGHNILGSKRSLAQITSDDCRAFVRRCYTTDNMLFFAHGNIESEQLLRLVAKHIGRDATKRCFQRQSLNQYKPQSIALNKKTSQTHCLIGTLTQSLKSDQTVRLTLLNNILGGTSFTSKLNLAARERNGWVYAIDSSLNLYSDTGVWAIYFGCSEVNFQKCSTLIYNELDKLIDKPLSHRQLEGYKQQLYGQILINSQNKESYILSAAKTALHLNKPVSIERTFEQISAIEPSDIRTTATELFNKELFTTLKYRQYSKH